MWKLAIAVGMMVLLGAVAWNAATYAGPTLVELDKGCTDEMAVTFNNPDNPHPVLYPVENGVSAWTIDISYDPEIVPVVADFSLTGPSPVIPVMGTVTFPDGPAEVVGQVTAFGEGTYAGFETEVIFEGLFYAIDPAGDFKSVQLQGEFSVGYKGSLPGGQPINYSFTCDFVQDDPTPTPTPDEKTYSVVVLKLDDATLLPLAGWKINLFAGANCQGTALDSQTTDEDGLAIFDGLGAGQYSVREKPQAGWNAVTDDCQDANPATAGTVGGAPPCPIQPDEPFPQPGCDTFISGGRVNVRINATDETNSVSLSGPTQVERENKPMDLDSDGLDEVKTEIVFMALTGGGIDVNESSTQASRGLIEEQQNSIPGQLEFPANSYFDVFFEVEIAGVTLHNSEPFHVECKIAAIPPYECLYQPDIPDPIDLLNDEEEKIAKLLHGLHIPVPPKAAFVIFANEQKPTPTPTATTEPGVPTATPGAGATSTPTLPAPGATSTPTSAPPTATPTPLAKPLGDVNDDGLVDSVDSLLILQFDAALIDELPNAESADVNEDGEITSVDAVLILQFDAGLIDALPPI